MDETAPQAPGLPGPWAKLQRDSGGLLTGWRALPNHCLDVAMVFRTLLEEPTLRTRLARLGDAPDLTPGQRDRLAVLAGLHDLGKANHGFQNKGVGARPQGGHLGEILALVNDNDADSAQALLQASDLAGLAVWFNHNDSLVEALFAIFSHHGRPIQPPADFPAGLWRAASGYDPIAAVRHCVAAVHSAFPGATDADPLPADAPFMHGFLGLLTLADWIGSDERFFPLDPLPKAAEYREFGRQSAAQWAVRQTGLKGGEGDSQGKEGELTKAAFEEVFRFPPNAIQQAALDHPLPGNSSSLHLLEAETGSGKTEMALAWFLRLYRTGQVDGLYFALPTRAAAVQIHRRVKAFAQEALEEAAPEVVLAVPGYTPPSDTTGSGIRSDHQRYDERGADTERSWAAEHPKRYMAGRLVVGTVDQVLMSGLQVKHSHMRAAALLRHLLIVDEVHASDPYMARILEGVLHRHQAAGGHALLLSATLGEAARSRFLNPGRNARYASAEEAISRPYPVFWKGGEGPGAHPLAQQGTSKDVSVELEGVLSDPQAVARLALEAASQGARVGILRNTVAEAVATQRALEAADPQAPLFACNGRPAPHHGRFAREDRIRLDQTLEQRLAENGPLVVAATQTIEQSLDIDFDLLITDLCPIDVLLQRLGRLHRHTRTRPTGHDQPKVKVLTPEGSLGNYLRADGQARGPGGLGSVYPDLGVLENTRQLLAERQELRIPEDSRILIEQALHPDRLRGLADSLGEPWMSHWSRMWGVKMAQENTAGLNLVDWWQPLSQTRYTEPGEEVRTRLGSDSRRLVLPKGTIGAFQEAVSEITVPGWMAEGISDDPTIEVEPVTEGEMVIRADQRRYRYDCFGLRPEEDSRD